MCVCVVDVYWLVCCVCVWLMFIGWFVVVSVFFLGVVVVGGDPNKGVKIAALCSCSMVSLVLLFFNYHKVCLL